MGRIKLTFGDKKVTYDSAIRTSSEMFENYQNTMANHQQTVLKNLISDFNLRKKEERDVNLEYMKQRLYRPSKSWAPQCIGLKAPKTAR